MFAHAGDGTPDAREVWRRARADDSAARAREDAREDEVRARDAAAPFPRRRIARATTTRRRRRRLTTTTTTTTTTTRIDARDAGDDRGAA